MDAKRESTGSDWAFLKLVAGVATCALVPCISWAQGADTERHALLLLDRDKAKPNVFVRRQPASPMENLQLVKVKVDRTNRIYFQRCAGCHGPEREGMTGKPLTTAITRKRGFKYLRDIIHYGSLTKGMPNWGTSGELSANEVASMARYLLKAPARPPKLANMSEVRASWTVLVPDAERPTKQRNRLDLDKELLVKILDRGRIELVDATSNKTVSVIKSDHRAIRARLSASNRFLYTLDCAAKVRLFDLWMETPKPVAEVTVGSEGRSIEPSGEKGSRELLLLAGSNWPPQYVVLDGRTLEPTIVHQFQDFGDVHVGCSDVEK